MESDIAEDDILPVSYLFGDGEELPKLEKLALKHCRGRILDVGAAAGRHSLILQQQGHDVTALDISALCCQVMEKRGVRKVIAGDFYQHKGEHYDTLLFLMNGIGIAGTVAGLDGFLQQARQLLKPGGQLLFDSSDVDYMYYEEDGSKWLNLNAVYYGELRYRMRFRNITGDEFPWLFIDFDTRITSYNVCYTKLLRAGTTNNLDG